MNDNTPTPRPRARAREIILGLIETAGNGGVATYGIVECRHVAGGGVAWSLDGKPCTRAEAYAIVLDGES